jgi:peroxiredoxin
MAGPQLQQLMRTLQSARTESGDSLVALSEASPLLLVFLRHAGCPFCREAIDDLARARTAIEASGARIVLVHMGDSAAIERRIGKHGLASVDRICDRQQNLYRAFGLQRGTLRQLFGLKVWWRGFQAAILARHGIARPSADSFQMPGVFLIGQARIAGRFRHRTAADRPDYAAICAVPVHSGRSL